MNLPGVHAEVGDTVGEAVGYAVGYAVGALVGEAVGYEVGNGVGIITHVVHPSFPSVHVVIGHDVHVSCRWCSWVEKGGWERLIPGAV